MPSTELIPTSSAQHLTARLTLPVGGEPTAYALLAHFTPEDPGTAPHLTRALNAAGLGVLQLDAAGLGVADLVAAARFLEANYRAPQLLVGHSLGGAAVLLAAAQLPSVRAVATLGAPAEPKGVLKLVTDHQAVDIGETSAEKAGQEVSASLAGRPFTLTKGFLEALSAQHMRARIGKLERALLVMHAPLDTVIGIDNAATIYGAAKHPKSFVTLDDADHLLTREADAHYAGTVIAAWAHRYLKAETPARWTDAADNRVTARTEGSLYTELRADGWSLVADEPVSVGGTGLGPTPYDYLAAALASCTSMTLRLYADRKRWPLEAATVGVKHSKVHARDCKDCEEKGAKLDLFEREVALTGPLDEGQRQRLLEIANRCPVHRTLESEVRVTTRLET